MSDKIKDGSYVNQNAQELAEKLEDLEEKLGITIEKLDGGSLEQVTTAALSGDLLADIIWMHQQGYWPAAKQNALLLCWQTKKGEIPGCQQSFFVVYAGNGKKENAGRQ